MCKLLRLKDQATHHQYQDITSSSMRGGCSCIFLPSKSHFLKSKPSHNLIFESGALKLARKRHASTKGPMTASAQHVMEIAHAFTDTLEIFRPEN
jgi:hypothetical protein